MGILVYALLIGVLVVATFTDLKYGKVYNWLTLPAIAAMIIIRIFHHPQGVLTYVWALVPFVILFLAAALTKGKAFGGGDLMLVLFIGVSSGVFITYLTLINSFIVGGLVFLITLAFANKSVRMQKMAPALFIGFILSYIESVYLFPNI